jgi:hypothetical protein
MTTFDPGQFLNLEISEPTSRRTNLPIGDYTAVIGAVRAETWTGKPGSKNEGKMGVRYVVPLAVEVPPDVAAQTGITSPTITLTDSIMLDTTPEGALDMAKGRNGALRRYREAIDMNKPGDAFSAARMEGRVIRVKVGADLWNGEPVERVEGVSRA